MRSILWTVGILLGGTFTLAMPAMLIGAVVTGLADRAHNRREYRTAATLGVVGTLVLTAALSEFLMAAYGRTLVRQGLLPWLIYPTVLLVGLVPVLGATSEGAKPLEDAPIGRLRRRSGYVAAGLGLLLGAMFLADEAFYGGATGIAGFVSGVMGTSVGTVLPWLIRLAVVWFAWTVSLSAFGSTRTPWRTLSRAVLLVFALAAFAAYRVGRETDDSCDPDPLYGGCSSYARDVTLGQRARAATWVLLLLGGSVAAAAWRHRARFPDPDSTQRAKPDPD